MITTLSQRHSSQDGLEKEEATELFNGFVIVQRIGPV